MVHGIQSPAQAAFSGVREQLLFAIIQLLGLACFAYIVAQRLKPLLHAAADVRLDRLWLRFGKLLKYWFGQWKHPRYPVAGTLHIVILAGFLVLSIRSLQLVVLGFSANPTALTASATPGFYNVARDYAATLVFIACAIAAIRRGVFRPARYNVPAQYGKDHTVEALFVLGLISTLMLAESLIEASQAAYKATAGHVTEWPAPFTLAWIFSFAVSSSTTTALKDIYFSSYLVHDLTFFAFLCFLPMGKHFHVVTSLFNVFFAKLDRGTVKPVRWDVKENQLDQVKSFGVKKFEDFTWKHMLDFYSCADCGRCSDNCPSNAAGRPLSPRFLTIKARDYCFQNFPVLGRSTNGHALIGGIYSVDEVWSCTTCGACEEECPLMIEYIDKIVDLRRGLVDDGNVPKSIQKALQALESRGNPYGKMEKKKADWTKDKEFEHSCKVKVLNGSSSAQTLFFVDSITSYDDRIQAIGRATARVLSSAGEDFAILGAAEKDSGHDARRFGEEMLFMALRDHNTDVIRDSGVQRIVTSDPHAFNALKHDYKDLPPVEHISQVIAREIKSGRLRLNPVANGNNVYTYHDPCYLGRHNQVYDDPRDVLDAIPGLKRVEMRRCRDRSYCCGGGGLMLFYEPKEEERIGVKRVRMAAEAGANVIVTACPFCMVNIEDAIKVAGLEGKMTAIDLAELVDQQLEHEPLQTDSVVEEVVASMQV